MRNCSISKKVFLFFVGLYLTIAFVLLLYTPITHKEALFLYTNKFSLTTFVVQKIYALTHNLIAIRIPFFLASSLSILFFLNFAKKYIQTQGFVYLSALIFLLTPGFFVSLIVANYASFAILLSFLTIYLLEKKKFFLAFFPLVLLFFSSTAQIAFYVALFFYSYFNKNYFFAFVNLILFVFSLYFERFEIGGVPKGHLIDLFTIHAVIFSPFYLLALIYAIYRFLIKEKKSIIWYVVFSAFLLSLLLSIRQKISVTDFSVYMVSGAILAVMVFEKSVQIRLLQFRKNYYKVCQIVLLFLFLETILIAFNYPIYKFSQGRLNIIDSSIYKIAQIAKEKKCIKKTQKRHQNLYRYYNLTTCQQNVSKIHK